ncbi:hypothetical protein HPP92_025924 [Vanilla planifolia]|uniref:Uncharacterized protein n=1 Tax=Vanilla planifolia TaxID=51239 RepID=A0A835PG90_VANPL|nr:hypothetical protein HPP92_025924 [Vanilla planifolia]
MELEFYQELLLSAVFSIILAFLIGKIAVIGSGDGDQEGDASISSDLASAAASGEKSEGSVVEPTQDVGHLGEGSAVEEVKAEENVRCRDAETDHPLSIAEGDGDGDEGSLLCGEDGWEGIERSELENLFGLASAFVGGPRGAVALGRLSSDLQMELYGLYKVATEGLATVAAIAFEFLCSS